MTATVLAVASTVALPCLLAGERADHPANTRLPVPSYRITDRGSLGLWAQQSPVTVRWFQRRAAGSTVSVDLSRDGGETWRSLGIARAEREQMQVDAPAETGLAWIRVRDVEGGVVSSRRRVRVTSKAVEAAYGRVFGAALHTDGGVRVWGYFGESEFPRDPSNLTRPVIVDGFPRIVAMDAGGYHVAGIDAEGGLWLWGMVAVRRPQADEPLVYQAPRREPGVEGVTWVRAASGATYFTVGDDRVFGISHRGHGLTFDGQPGLLDAVVEIPEFDGATDLRFGLSHGLALHSDGRVLSFGANYLGQLGDPGRDFVAGPQPVPGIEGAIAIAANVETSMALLADGTVLAWGADPASGFAVPEPRVVEGLPPAKWIACGDATRFAISRDDILYGWGRNLDGSLGTGDFEFRESPAPMAAGRVRTVAIGEAVGQAILADGRRVAWGNGQSNPLGLGERNFRFLGVPTLMVSR